MVSVLTPASRYAVPFIRRLAAEGGQAPLWVIQGRGAFGRQVCDGAEQSARASGIEVIRADGPPAGEHEGAWDVFCAGTFEDDVRAFRAARRVSPPPGTACCVAAGVRDFAGLAGDPDGAYGVGQWFPDAVDAPRPRLGLSEAEFLDAYSRLVGTAPDYPAVQAAATAALASHCARQAAGTSREALWQAAAALDTRTLFGRFRIDSRTGTQVGHEAVLVRWAGSGLVGA
jgi:ABC-type branched-subunit amino acid transport system substrate-binding protein